MRLLEMLHVLSTATADSQRYVFVSVAVARSLSKASSEKELKKVKTLLRPLELDHGIGLDTR